ncbi:MBL fold metallo-hydrolase [Bradyrhizobium oligotrophicum]|uniref:MBL fold metallo-hydrolase n=1 Tax=Bradyrhizobium oligotrophicum TaxID=44255 RepID=UPI003EC0ABC9
MRDLIVPGTESLVSTATVAKEAETALNLRFRMRLKDVFAKRLRNEPEGTFEQALLDGPDTPSFLEIERSCVMAQISREDGVSWQAAGIIIGEELRHLAMTIRQTKFEALLAQRNIALRDPFAVVRQEAVGHGGFHTGALGFTHPQFRWVYDCGSWRKRAILRQRIFDFLDRARVYGRRKIDLLFLSHFDADHVNGLEVLFAGTEGKPLDVDTVVAPYLDPIDRFASLGRAIAKDQCPPDLVDAVATPEDYFGDRGVRRLILVKPDDDPGTPPGEGRPSPPPRPYIPRDKSNPLAVDAITAGGQFLTEDARTMAGKLALYVVEPGLWFEASSEKRWLDWIFVPHAYRWRFNRVHLADRIRKVVGVDPDHPQFCASLVGMLRTRKGLNDVKRIYCGMDSNGTSLSLYAGPGYRGLERWSFTGRKPLGWLMTGDAPLNRQDAFREWKEAYLTLSEKVGRLMLPHHGAERNFNPELFEFFASSTPFLTVDKRDFDNEKRPPAAVRRKLPRALDAVTEQSDLVDVSGQQSADDLWNEVIHW